MKNVEKKRGQAAVEFLLYSVVFLGILLAAVFVVNFVQSQDVNYLDYLKSTNEFHLVSKDVILAFYSPKNSTYCITFPHLLNSHPYTLFFDLQYGAPTKLFLRAEFQQTTNFKNKSISILVFSGNANLVNFNGLSLMYSGQGGRIYKINNANISVKVDEKGKINIIDGGC